MGELIHRMLSRGTMGLSSSEPLLPGHACPAASSQVPCTLPASVPAHAEISEVGVASLRLLPARSPPRHGALHADKSSSSLGRPEKSALTLLPTPQRPQALKPITGAQHRGADAEVGWGCGRSFQVPRRAAGWKGCMHSHPAWAPAQGARLLRQGEVRVSHPNRGP